MRKYLSSHPSIYIFHIEVTQHQHLILYLRLLERKHTRLFSKKENEMSKNNGAMYADTIVI